MAFASEMANTNLLPGRRAVLRVTGGTVAESSAKTTRTVETMDDGSHF